MCEDNVDFFKTIIQKFLKFKVLTMAVVYGNDQNLLYLELFIQIYE